MLAGAWIAHPERDLFLEPCPGDTVNESLNNILRYNDVDLPYGRNPCAEAQHGFASGNCAIRTQSCTSVYGLGRCPHETAHSAVADVSTFLTNHVRDLVSIDFFTVPTAGLRVLFVPVVLAHHRRRVVHFNVTEHSTAHWTSQQIVDARTTPRRTTSCT